MNVCSFIESQHMRYAMWKVVFFFKQKTAYEMRISDWSSDVCSSDLTMVVMRDRGMPAAIMRSPSPPTSSWEGTPRRAVRCSHSAISQIGRASCRERVCQYV